MQLVVLGEPLGKERPRYTNCGGFIRTYTPQKTINYESLIAHEYNEKYGTLMFGKDEPVHATITAYYGLNRADFGKKGINKSGREKIANLYCPAKSDIDNIVKSILDALNSICFYDDKQVVSINASKCYTLKSPRVEILLEGLNEKFEK